MPIRRPVPEREIISELTTSRLSVYLRCLGYLESIRQKTVSSAEMAERFHLNSAQIRKDLACLGEFGTRGVGYNVMKLKEHLVQALGIDRSRKVVIAGAGNLGMALADYRGFNGNGFQIAALVDVDPLKIGRFSRTGIPVVALSDLRRIVRHEGVEIGVIAVNAEAAQEVFDALVDAGLNAILNFAPVQLRKHPHVKLKSVDLRINLESLSFFLKSSENGGETG